jgi:hypothetical protein
MSERVPAGTWVELHRVVLPPGHRAASVPADTQDVPLELRVKGVLVADAAVGEEAEVFTPAGRVLAGTLETVAPAYLHTFGPPEPALLAVGPELRALLHDGRAER